jgi:hypothetical protein
VFSAQRLLPTCAPQFRNAILSYSRDAATIIGRPNTILIGSHALGRCQTATEDGKVFGAQPEIL